MASGNLSISGVQPLCFVDRSMSGRTLTLGSNAQQVRINSIRFKNINTLVALCFLGISFWTSWPNLNKASSPKQNGSLQSFQIQGKCMREKKFRLKVVLKLTGFSNLKEGSI